MAKSLNSILFQNPGEIERGEGGGPVPGPLSVTIQGGQTVKEKTLCLVCKLKFTLYYVILV